MIRFRWPIYRYKPPARATRHTLPVIEGGN